MNGYSPTPSATLAPGRNPRRCTDVIPLIHSHWSKFNRYLSGVHRNDGVTIWGLNSPAMKGTSVPSGSITFMSNSANSALSSDY